VLSTVGPAQTGVASGFNSAVARAGGLIATALLGVILSSHGDTLVAAFHVAVMLSGAAAFAAGVFALVLPRDAGVPRG
jgi:hypothetical protein